MIHLVTNNGQDVKDIFDDESFQWEVNELRFQVQIWPIGDSQWRLLAAFSHPTDALMYFTRDEVRPDHMRIWDTLVNIALKERTLNTNYVIL